MIAQVFPSLRVLDRARSQLAYLRFPGFGEPPGAGFESLAPGFETYDAFLAARYEAEGFVVNSTDAETAAEAVKRIRRDPSHCLKPVFLLHEAGPLAADLADGQVRSLDQAESLLADFRHNAGAVVALPPAAEGTVLLRYLSLRPGKVLKPHRDWRDPQIYSYPLAALLMPGLSRQPQALDMLRERGFLELDDLVDRLRLCPECRNAQTGFIDVCPQCHGLKIGEQPFLHCFTCGFVGPQPEFVKGGTMRCPRCQESLRHIGVDYDRALDHWQCATCAHLFEDPEIKARCGICLWSGPSERLIARPIEKLRLGEAGRRAALDGAVPNARVSGPARAVMPDEFHQILDWHIRLGRSNAEASCGVLCIGIRAAASHRSGDGDTPIGEALAQHIAQSLRGTDIVARGPDEVLWVLLPGTNGENTARVLGRLLDGRSLDAQGLVLRSAYAVAAHGLHADDSADPLMARLQAQVIG